MRRRGFTLIELLVVIGIIGLLMAEVSIAVAQTPAAQLQAPPAPPPITFEDMQGFATWPGSDEGPTDTFTG